MRRHTDCDDVRSIIQHRVEKNRVKIEEMMKLQGRMKQALKQWESMPNGTPDGDRICHSSSRSKKV